MTLNRKKLSLIAVLFVMLCLSPIVWEETTFALDGADVAIYNDSSAPVNRVTGAKRSGAWQDGIIAIKCMLHWMGLSHEEISYRDLNDPRKDISSLYKVLLFPGGFAYWYNYWISSLGKNRIRNFVNNGGGYFGICAGAFFASDTVMWEGISYGDGYLYNAYGEMTGYDLDLFSGTATGPINGIAPWPTYGMTTIHFETESEILSGYKTVPFSEDFFYYGGPYFTLAQDQNVKVLGNYDYTGKPALVAFTYGSGRVILTGPHPEIDVDSQRDCTTIDGEDEMNDEGSDWELSRHLFKWIIEASDCLAIATDLSIRVPCAEYYGNPYGFSASFINRFTLFAEVLVSGFGFQVSGTRKTDGFPEH